MKRLLLAVTLSVASVLLLSPARADVMTIDFDGEGFQTGIDIYPMPAEYAGLSWSKFDYTTPAFFEASGDAYKNSGYAKGTVSGNVGYNAYASDASVSTVSGDGFYFLGGYFTPAWYNQGRLRITGTGLDGQTYVDEFNIFFPGYDDHELAFHEWAYSDVKMSNLVFSSVISGFKDSLFQKDGYQIAFDDLKFSDTRMVSEVPEPGTLALLGFAFAAIPFARRRKRS